MENAGQPALKHSYLFIIYTTFVLTVLFQNVEASRFFPAVTTSISSAAGPVISAEILEEQIHSLINSERESRGMPPLKVDGALRAAARRHGADMAANGYFSHTNRKGEGPTERARNVGYRCSKKIGAYTRVGVAENLFQNVLYDFITYVNGKAFPSWKSQDEIAESTVKGWMNSPGHRRNILNRGYDVQGIGVVISTRDNKVYIVEMFC